MKVLLINPPARTVAREAVVVPPLGLAYLAAVLLADGHEVEILDAFGLRMSWTDFEADLAARGPDLIGLTGMTPVIDATWRALEVVRQRKDGVRVVLGGAHVSAAPDRIAREWPAGVDFAVNGEGEYVLRDLVRGLERDEDVTQMPGLVLPGQVNRRAPRIEDLDDLPMPARHLLPNDCYRYSLLPKNPVTTAFTSRGCPFPCIFCDKAVFGSAWRVRSPQLVADEVEEAVENYGIRSLIFYDDLFTLRKERVLEICRRIVERGLEIEWKCEGRVETVDEETLGEMKRAGCTMIAYGVESGNQAGLDYLSKRSTPLSIRTAFDRTRAAGIRTLAYFLLGIPSETYEDELNTVRFAMEIKADYAQFSVLSPFPGTPVYDWAVKEGLYREIDAHNPVDKDLKRPAIICGNWTEEALARIVGEAHRRFYLRPGYIMHRLLAVRSLNELMQTLTLGGHLLRWCLKRG